MNEAAKVTERAVRNVPQKLEEGRVVFLADGYYRVTEMRSRGRVTLKALTPQETAELVERLRKKYPQMPENA